MKVTYFIPGMIYMFLYHHLQDFGCWHQLFIPFQFPNFHWSYILNFDPFDSNYPGTPHSSPRSFPINVFHPLLLQNFLQLPLVRVLHMAIQVSLAHVGRVTAVERVGLMSHI